MLDQKGPKNAKKSLPPITGYELLSYRLIYQVAYKTNVVDEKVHIKIDPQIPSPVSPTDQLITGSGFAQPQRGATWREKKTPLKPPAPWRWKTPPVIRPETDSALRELRCRVRRSPQNVPPVQTVASTDSVR